MQSWFVRLMLITSLTSCNKDATVLEDPLYRKWQIVQIQYKTGELVTASEANTWAIVTFKSNGMLLYGNDGKYEACCSPNRFTRKGTTLDLVDVASIPLPERTPNPTCTLVDCAPFDSSWQIETLSDKQLIIKQTKAVITYRPYP
ncbi:hypothetical protein [Spirosoma sp.]|uniref:hypothetical protein n=1 Tax=Spirosoma sp. TaxID=1899569 RepID=UPI003B3A54F3